MSASQRGPVASAGLECPGWQTWVSTTGRWWAVREATLTSRQISAGCLRQVHAATQEGLGKRISDQEALGAIAAADLADWPPGWRGGRAPS
jgi:hypothetical protein